MPGEVMCSGVDGNILAWANAVADSGIDCQALLKLCLVAWLNKPTFSTVSNTLSFSQLVSNVCNMAGTVHWSF